MLRLLACLVLAWFACPATACINDVELPNHEREFRSQYRRQASPPAASPNSPSLPPRYHLLMGGGSALLIGALGVMVVGLRARG